MRHCSFVRVSEGMSNRKNRVLYVVASSALTACALASELDDVDARSRTGETAGPAANEESLAPTDWRMIDASACPPGFVCLYQNANRGGTMLALAGGISIADMRTIRCPGCTDGSHGNDGTFDDQTSALENRSGRRYCWYAEPFFRGVAHTIGDVVITIFPEPANDTLSSIRPC
jgi:hypothetical protein